MRDERLDELWKDDKHWRWWGYVCSEDPRLLVPKRIPVMGWAINGGHPKKAILIFFLILAVATVPTFLLLAVRNFRPGVIEMLAMPLISVAAVLLICVFFARPPRRN